MADQIFLNIFADNTWKLLLLTFLSNYYSKNSIFILSNYAYLWSNVALFGRINIKKKENTHFLGSVHSPLSLAFLYCTLLCLLWHRWTYFKISVSQILQILVEWWILKELKKKIKGKIWEYQPTKKNQTKTKNQERKIFPIYHKIWL